MIQLTEKIPATDATIKQLDRLIKAQSDKGMRIMSHMELVASLINIELLRELKQ